MTGSGLDQHGTGSAGGSATRARAALDDLGQLLLAEHTQPSVLRRIVELVQQAMPPGSEVSITLIRDERPTTVAVTGPLAEVLDETQYERGHGPCLDAALGGLFTEITDARSDHRWPDHLPVFLEHGALSVLAAPVPAAHPMAALNVYGRAPAVFSDDDRASLGQFAAHAGAALLNMATLQDARDLAENLRKATEFRSVIEQAKGILMERYRLTADQAFRVLADASMHTNRKVRALAEDLVLTGELADSPSSGRPPSAGRPPSPGR